MKILFIARDVTPTASTGDAIHVRELIDNISKLGHRISVIGRDVQNVSSDVFIQHQRVIEGLSANKNVSVHLLKSRLKLSFRPTKNFNGLLTGIKLFKKHDYDIIYSRPAAPFDIRIELLLSKLFNVPLVLEINGIGPVEYKMRMQQKSSGITEDIALAEHQYIFSASNGIVAVTKGIADIMHDKYLVPYDKINVISNGVNEELFRPAQEKNTALLKNLGIGEDKKVICFVGSFNPWHGLEDLVTVGGKVVSQDPNVVFLMVGDGILRNKIQELVTESGLDNNFVFTGRVPYEDVHHYINASDICVAPYPLEYTSTIELSPLKLYSYLACGKPIVSTDIGGIADVIRSSGAGVLVRPEDPDGLAEGILNLLNDYAGQMRMGQLARQYALKYCTWKQTAEQVLKVCRQVIRNYKMEQPAE